MEQRSFRSLISIQSWCMNCGQNMGQHTPGGIVPFACPKVNLFVAASNEPYPIMVARRAAQHICIGVLDDDHIMMTFREILRSVNAVYEISQKLHGLVESSLNRFTGYLPVTEVDSVVNAHRMFINDTMKKADAVLESRLTENIYNIFSGEHNSWWRANSEGYTKDKKQAGRYTWSEAQAATKNSGGEKMLKFELVEIAHMGYPATAINRCDKHGGRGFTQDCFECNPHTGMHTIERPSGDICNDATCVQYGKTRMAVCEGCFLVKLNPALSLQSRLRDMADSMELPHNGNRTAWARWAREAADEIDKKEAVKK